MKKTAQFLIATVFVLGLSGISKADLTFRTESNDAKHGLEGAAVGSGNVMPEAAFQAADREYIAGYEVRDDESRGRKDIEDDGKVAAVPLPGTALLFGAGLAGLVLASRRRAES